MYLDEVRLQGFSSPVRCRSLASGEHSFNFLKRQMIPDEVEIMWRLGGGAESRVRLSLSMIPGGLKGGEIFFVLREDNTWGVEWDAALRLDKLQAGE